MSGNQERTDDQVEPVRIEMTEHQDAITRDQPDKTDLTPTGSSHAQEEDDELESTSPEELRRENRRLAALVQQLQAQVVHLENARQVWFLAQRAGVRSCALEYASMKHLYSMR